MTEKKTKGVRQLDGMYRHDCPFRTGKVAYTKGLYRIWYAYKKDVG